MTPLLFLGLALAGGLGATCRLLVDGAVRARTTSALPWGTIVINLSGSFLLGLLTGLATHHWLPEGVHLVIGTGFLGGYTTFSTASLENVRLAQEGRWGTAALNGLGVLVTATAAAAAGLWLGSLP